MSKANQIKSLIKSHFDENREHFVTVALQLAAHEARLGHTTLAHDIRILIDEAKKESPKVIPLNRELSDLVMVSEPVDRMNQLIVSNIMKQRIERILREFKLQDKIKKYGLNNRRKILIAGPPGTGKTMTAGILAAELHLPLFTILMDKLVTKFMGETSAKLRQIFEIIKERQGIFLFDEFDAIGGERGMENDVGEMRRVLNAFLQFIEQDKSDSLIIAATNNARLLDQALFRRFDDILYYKLPDEQDIEGLIQNRLAFFNNKKVSYNMVVKDAKNLSHAEIVQACDDAIKESILSDKEDVTVELLRGMMRERMDAYRKK
jgi:SpoVK/Ycf46/Vps4 family AAA+-type ATPase